MVVRGLSFYNFYLFIFVAVFCSLLGLLRAQAQGVAGVDPYTNQLIERVQVKIVSPSDDAGLNARVEDSVRTTLALFPGQRFSQQQLELRLAQTRRIRDVGAVEYGVSFGRRGG